MSHCKIHPMPLSLVAFNAISMLNSPTPSRPIFMVVYSWYIEGAKEKILGDSECLRSNNRRLRGSDVKGRHGNWARRCSSEGAGDSGQLLEASRN